jgi:hypothetical protein
LTRMGRGKEADMRNTSGECGMGMRDVEGARGRVAPRSITNNSGVGASRTRRRRRKRRWSRTHQRRRTDAEGETIGAECIVEIGNLVEREAGYRPQGGAGSHHGGRRLLELLRS